MSDVKFKSMTAKPFVFLYGQRETDMPGIAKTGRGIMDGLQGFIRENGAQPLGGPVWVYEHLGGGKVLLKAGVPIQEGPRSRDGFTVAREPEWKCASSEYRGGMQGIGAAWEAFTEAVKQAGLEPLNINREIYHKWIDMDSPGNITELQVKVA